MGNSHYLQNMKTCRYSSIVPCKKQDRVKQLAQAFYLLINRLKTSLPEEAPDKLHLLYWADRPHAKNIFDIEEPPVRKII